MIISRQDEARGSHSTRAPDASSPEVAGASLHHESDELISRSSANILWSRHRAQSRQQDREHKRVMEEVQAAAAAMSSTPSVHPIVPPATPAIIPFFVHPTHKSFYCGGFVACTSCGFINSQGKSTGHVPISKPCVPDPSGGKRLARNGSSNGYKTTFLSVGRLRRGLAPYHYDRWPDGSSLDEVLVPRPLYPTSTDPDARLGIPTSGTLAGI